MKLSLCASMAFAAFISGAMLAGCQGTGLAPGGGGLPIGAGGPAVQHLVPGLPDNLSQPSAHETSATLNDPRIVEFDDPDAGTGVGSSCGAFCGTVPLANNNHDKIVGAYSDSAFALHAFLRDPGGKFTNFDAPGAGSSPGVGTAAYSVNRDGWVAGDYQDASLVYHGFLRRPNGSIQTFEAPKAGTAKYQGTQAFSLNDRGETAGNYIDALGVQHGFVRSPDGKVTSFDPRGSTFTFVCEETCLNDKGDATGVYCDSSNALHGFLRHRNGRIDAIDAKGEGANCNYFTGTVPASINSHGTIAGYYIDTKGYAHSFVRHPTGKMSYFDVVHSKRSDPCVYTLAFSINDDDTTAGIYALSTGGGGFSRSRSGDVTKFTAPGAITGSCFFSTRVSTNNARGDITGWWIDPSHLNHGFLWKPGRV